MNTSPLRAGLAGAWERLGESAERLGLDEQGFVIRSVGADLVVAGRTNLAVVFGVGALAERYLGCRWFWPGESGIVAPRAASLRVGTIDDVSRPDFPLRWVMRDKACARFHGANVGLGEPDDFRTR